MPKKKDTIASLVIRLDELDEQQKLLEKQTTQLSKDLVKLTVMYQRHLNLYHR